MHLALRTLISALLLVPFALAGLALARQDPPAEAPPRSPGLQGLGTDERARVEEALEGAWLLLRYDPPDALFDPTNVQGVALFHDGYLSLNVMAQTFQREFLGDGRQLFVQGGAHRFRIDEFLRLQTAAVMSFHNFDDEDLIQLEPSGSPREYDVKLDEGGKSMTLTKSDGTVLTWSKLGSSEFPPDSIEALNRVRGKIR
jgi:hypothetical protein